MNVYPCLFSKDPDMTFDEPGAMRLVLHGTLGDFSYNVVSNDFDRVQVQFDIPEDHPLYGLDADDDFDFYDGDFIPFSDLRTVEDKDGITTWAMCDIPLENCLISLIMTDRELLSALMWHRVSLAALAAYEWLEKTNRKNYIADNGNGK